VVNALLEGLVEGLVEAILIIKTDENGKKIE
jgi:hypothetical protein